MAREKESLSSLEVQFFKLREEMNSLQHRIRENTNPLSEEYSDQPVSSNIEHGSSLQHSDRDNTEDLGKYVPLTELNTETVSMYSVLKIVDKKVTKPMKFLLASANLFFVCLQCLYLHVIFYESTPSECDSVADCPAGTYCTHENFFIDSHTLCRDCRLANKYSIDVTACESDFTNFTWDRMQFLSLDHTIQRIFSDTNSTLLNCLAYKHCSINDMDSNSNLSGHCDFIDLNMSKMDISNWLLISFMGLLWALPVSKDIKEATIEEKYLFHHIGESFSFPAEITRLSLRMKRFVLPYHATFATITLIISEHDISSKNIILNFLSITFILEADNVLYELFMGTHQKELMKKAVERNDRGPLLIPESITFWARIGALICPVIMIFVLATITESVHDCDNIVSFFTSIFMVMSTVMTLVRGCSYAYALGGDKLPTRIRILEALIEVVRNFLALVTEACFFISFYYILKSNDEWIVSKLPENILYQILFIGPLPLLISLEIYKRKCNKKVKEPTKF